MKLIISTVVVGIVLFLLGWVVYGILLAEYLQPYYGFMQRPDYDMKIWAFALASLTQAFMLYLLYSKIYKGGTPFAEGFRFGLWITIFTTVPYALFTWGGVKVSYKGVLPDAIAMGVMMMIACIVTAIIYGKRSVEPV
jgi:uncharacterized membrane protein